MTAHADQATDRVQRCVVAAVLPDGTSAGDRVTDRLLALKARHEHTSPKRIDDGIFAKRHARNRPLG
jgi:hypothetical protein